jgi:hypothetical protein
MLHRGIGFACCDSASSWPRRNSPAHAFKGEVSISCADAATNAFDMMRLKYPSLTHGLGEAAMFTSVSNTKPRSNPFTLSPRAGPATTVWVRSAQANNGNRTHSAHEDAGAVPGMPEQKWR